MQESLQPVSLVHLNGVSNLIKCEAKKGSASVSKTTGIITSFFPAWQMPNLVLQLIFGFGSDGHVIPNVNIHLSDSDEEDEEISKSKKSSMKESTSF